MIDASLERFIHEIGLAYIATLDPGGGPSLSPKASWVVADAEHLACCDIASAGTRRNVQRDPRVTVVIVDELRRRGFRLRGHAEILGPGNLIYDTVTAKLWTRHGTHYPVESVICVTVQSVQSLHSPAYEFGGANERRLATAAWEKLRRRYTQICDPTL